MTDRVSSGRPQTTKSHRMRDEPTTYAREQHHLQSSLQYCVSAQLDWAKSLNLIKAVALDVTALSNSQPIIRQPPSSLIVANEVYVRHEAVEISQHEHFVGRHVLQIYFQRDAKITCGKIGGGNKNNAHVKKVLKRYRSLFRVSYGILYRAMQAAENVALLTY